MGSEIGPGITPQFHRCRQIDQTEHRDDDRGSQSGDRQVEQQRCQEKRCQRDAHRRIGPGGGGLSPGVEIHYRSGEAAGNRIAARKCCGDVGCAQPDQFLIRRNPLAAFGRQSLRDRYRFDKTDDRDQQRRNP